MSRQHRETCGRVSGANKNLPERGFPVHIQKDILTRALCLGKGVLGTIRLEKAGGKAVLVASCRPRKGQECRCPECGRKAPAYDHAQRPRRWRTMDIGTMPAYIEYAPARVKLCFVTDNRYGVCPSQAGVSRRGCVHWAS